jgi:signal transduction histidine kinase
MDDGRFRELHRQLRRIRHDANNPLTAALGHVQLLLDDPSVSDPEVVESLRIVDGELRRLARILAQLSELQNEPGAAAPS